MVIEVACAELQLIPVMRAGMVLLDQASSTLPMSETYHVGLERDERTLRVCQSNLKSSCSACM